MDYQWPEIVNRMNKLLRLHNTPIGIKMFDTVEEMEQIPKLRRPKNLHTPCQVLSQAIQFGYTIGFTAKDIVIDNCSATVGIIPQDEEFKSGKVFAGGWCATPEDAAAHHQSLTSVLKPYDGVVASPLAAGRIEPDVCMMVMQPGEAFMLLAGFLRHDYKPLPLTHVGESSCSIHWVKTYQTGEIGFALPCFAEMRFAGYSSSEVNLTMKPADLVKALNGLEELNGCGFRYPVPSYAAQVDVCEGIGVSYQVAGSEKKGDGNYA